jgi:hypothetical protein
MGVMYASAQSVQSVYSHCLYCLFTCAFDCLCADRSFGLTNLEAIMQGKRGEECRGEEHEVMLSWSAHSRKTKVYWNNNEISTLYENKTQKGVTEFSWKTQSEESLQVKVASDSHSGLYYYDLVVDGKSFVQLPELKEIGMPAAANEESIEQVYEETEVR